MSTLSTQQIVEIAAFGIVVVALGFMLNLLMGMTLLSKNPSCITHHTAPNCVKLILLNKFALKECALRDKS
jgi:hypothetical protein